MNETPTANRIHIGFFGRRNAGKSSIVNAITGQDLSIVSEVPGTTTDPVFKAMELLPMGPVVIIDTPGIDDEGTLGALRIRKTKQILNKSDIALLIVDATLGKTEADDELLEIFRAKNIPYMVVWNKCDLLRKSGGTNQSPLSPLGESHEAFLGVRGELCKTTISPHPNPLPEGEGTDGIHVSATTKQGITELKERIAALSVVDENKTRLVADLIEPGGFVVLVIPLDKAAPKGRLILPQQQTIRDILESHAVAVTVRETELRETLKQFGKKPKLVITDSQVFGKVSAETPDDILLTSFSILFARYKGSLFSAVEGAKALDDLTDGDTILISEGCTHHRQGDDIGTVK
jgi:small GTP-binding protein